MIMITITILIILLMALIIILFTVFGSLTMIIYTIIAVPVAFVKALVENIEDLFEKHREYRKKKKGYKVLKDKESDNE